MLVYQAYACIRVLLTLTVSVVALVYWTKSRRRGFAWIGAACLVALASAVLLFVVYFIGPLGIRSPLVRYLILLPWFGMADILCAVLVFVGLREFYAERSRPVSASAPSDPWRSVSLAVRRALFLSTGLAFVGIGPLIVFRGGQTIGTGCVTALVGLVCLWLAVHPRSPLVKASRKRRAAQPALTDAYHDRLATGTQGLQTASQLRSDTQDHGD